MEVSNISQYTCEETIENAISAGNITTVKTAITSSVCIISAILAYVAYAISKEKDNMYVVLSIIMLFFGVFIIFLNYNTKKLVKKNSEKVFKNGLTYTYTFNKNGFKAICKYDDNEASSKIEYERIIKIKENEASYFLFINKTNFFPVKKSGFTSEEDFNFVYKRIEHLIKKKNKNK